MRSESSGAVSNSGLPRVLCVGGPIFKNLLASYLEEHGLNETVVAHTGNVRMLAMLPMVTEHVSKQKPHILVLSAGSADIDSDTLSLSENNVHMAIDNLKLMIDNLSFRNPHMKIVVLGQMPRAVNDYYEKYIPILMELIYSAIPTIRIS